MRKPTRGLLSFCIIMALSMSGCWMSRDKQNAIIKGAALGGLAGGAVGCGAAAAASAHSATAYGIGCPAGVGVGAIIGAILADLWYKAPVEAAPPPSPAPPPVAMERIVLRGVRFDFNKARIRPDAAPVLDEAADILRQHQTVTVSVNGYCDRTGSAAYNLRLSRRRARAVSSYLKSKGIASSRLTIHGYGRTHFVASNGTSEGRAENRRVELVPVVQ